MGSKSCLRRTQQLGHGLDVQAFGWSLSCAKCQKENIKQIQPTMYTLFAPSYFVPFTVYSHGRLSNVRQTLLKEMTIHSPHVEKLSGHVVDRAPWLRRPSCVCVASILQKGKDDNACVCESRRFHRVFFSIKDFGNSKSNLIFSLPKASSNVSLTSFVKRMFFHSQRTFFASCPGLLLRCPCKFWMGLGFAPSPLWSDGAQK